MPTAALAAPAGMVGVIEEAVKMAAGALTGDGKGQQQTKEQKGKKHKGSKQKEQNSKKSWWSCRGGSLSWSLSWSSWSSSSSSSSSLSSSSNDSGASEKPQSRPTALPEGKLKKLSRKVVLRKSCMSATYHMAEMEHELQSRSKVTTIIDSYFESMAHRLTLNVKTSDQKTADSHQL